MPSAMKTSELYNLLKYAQTPTQDKYLRAYIEHGTARAAAEACGVTKNCVSRVITEVRGYKAQGKTKQNVGIVASQVEFEDLPTKSMKYEELKNKAKERSKRKIKYDNAKKWRNIKFQSDEPIALAFIGDPHVDDDGCDWTLLDRDTQIIKESAGMYACNLGDTTNNWVGRLMALYAKQEATADQAWILAEGWLKELQESWLMLVQGNHDAWSGAGDPIKFIMRGHPAMDVYEWNVRVAFQFPELDPIRIWAAHDFKGKSQYHDIHGMIKARLWHSDPADIYACGHLHNWAMHSHEPTGGKLCHYLRARGYKFADSYADNLQFAGQNYGCTITAVMVPTEKGPRRITLYADVEEAAEVLEIKRQRRQV